MENNPQKVGIVLLKALSIIIFSVPIIYIFIAMPGMSFWDNAMGNMLTTVLALIIGIPIALYIDKKIRFMDKKERHQNEQEQEKQLLKLIKEELEFSEKGLDDIEHKKLTSFVIISSFKYDFWEAVSASGNIRLIKDVGLLKQIGSAYYLVKTLNKLAQYYYCENLRPTWENKKTNQDFILSDLQQLGRLTKIMIQKTYDLIDKHKLNYDPGTI